MARGTYTGHAGRPAVRFERHYPYPIDRLWRAVTQPAELAHWFPSRVTHDGRAGGRITFDGDPYSDPSTGTILTYVRPTAISFTWGEDVLHVTLAAAGDRCAMVLVNVLAEPTAAARNAAGWTICLDELDRWLAGTPGGGPHDPRAEARFDTLLAQYAADGMPTGAAVPGRKED